MKRYDSLIVAAWGMILVVASVAYGVFFAGIPGPDDSPAEAARVSAQGSLAAGGVCLGILFFLAGVVMGALRFRSHKKKQQP